MGAVRAWIPHNGEKRPVSAESMVFIKYRGGFEPLEAIQAEKRVWKWVTGDYAFEIVAYAWPDDKKGAG